MTARRGPVALTLVLAACAGDGAREPAAPPPMPWSQAPDVDVDLRARLSTDSAPLLADVTVWVDLFLADGVRSDFAPALPDGMRGEVAAGEPEALGSGSARRFTLRLQPVRLGTVEIAPWRAEGRRGDGGEPAVATTPTLTLEVTSLLEGHGAEVEAPAPPFAARWSPVPWLVGGGIASALAAGLWLWLRARRRRLRLARDETPLPPHARALRALARLRSAPRTTPAEVDAFYVEVSSVVRTYLEERFGLHAPERTTEEFLAELRAAADAPLDGRQRAALAEFLNCCDLVKFARWMPGEETHDASLGSAEDLVEATRADRSPVAREVPA